MKRLLDAVGSLRTTAWLLAILTALMLANVVVPQQDGAYPERYQRLVERGGAARFWLETAGLGRVSTSPVFVVVMALFFVNLAAVLVDRTGATLRRIRAAPPSPAQVAAFLRRDAVDLPAQATPAEARRVLEGLGYRVAPAGEGALWGVKNAAALLGFPLFHLSFFVLLAGGAQIYYTRQVGTAVVTEGQRIQGSDLRVVRRAPWREVPSLGLSLQRVDVALVDGEPVELAATLRADDAAAAPRTSRVNHPAEWGALSVLVEQAGLAPVLRVEDARGFTVDRVALVLSNQTGAEAAPLGATGLSVAIDPIPIGPLFPERASLHRTPLHARVLLGETVVYEGLLAPRTPVPVRGLFLQLEELRYWASLRVVYERGGDLLVLGFLLAVLGLVWRMVWFRREVVVTWTGDGVRLAGRCDFFPSYVHEELEGVRRHVARQVESRSAERGSG